MSLLHRASENVRPEDGHSDDGLTNISGLNVPNSTYTRSVDVEKRSR